MRPLIGCVVRCLPAFSGGFRGSFAMMVLSLVVLGGAFALDGDSATAVEPADYSAYEDAQKPVLSYILSQSQNAEDFQEEFALGDGEMEEVQTAIRAENETLAAVYAKSEQVIESNRKLSNERIASKISASSYDESVKQAIARTKSRIESILPKGQERALESWVDTAWEQEQQEVRSGQYGAMQASATGVTYNVFATQYNGYTRYEVALPHKRLKFSGGYRVQLERSGRSAWAPVKEVGPWNIRDNYWQPRRYRDMWKNLPQGMPEAEAAYFRNYNRGKDQFGREVLNPAGVDLTPAVAHRLGLRTYENAWVDVHYPWVRR